MSQDTHPDQRQHHKGPLIGLAIIIAIVAIITGGLMIHHHNDQQQMKEIVHSKEAKKIFDEDMRTMDPRAFTSTGIIRSYTIDDSSIRHSPMGGIMVTLDVNNDTTLYVHYTLNRYLDASGEYGPLVSEGGGNSGKLEKMLKP